MRINDRLKKLRLSKNLNQNEIADILGVSLSSYQKYEREKNSVTPSLDVLIRIADYYSVSLDYIVGRSAEAQEPIDQLERSFDMSALEKKILTNYLALPENLRGDFMTFLQNAVREIESSNQPSD